MKIKIDRDNCISCGLCEENYPNIFKLETDGIAAVKKQPSAEEEECVKKSIEECPTGAIEKEKGTSQK